MAHRSAIDGGGPELSKRPLSYRYKPNHRVSVPVFLRLHLTALGHGLADLGVRSLPGGDGFGFVAGCGHSGTTLLASKLGLHPDVLLISRESNLFLPERGLRLARVIAEEWLAFARQEDRRVVLEKSPKHVHCLHRIRRLLPGVRVIVNPGGTNERFVAERLGRADKILHPDNRSIFAEIVQGRADVMFTDRIEVELQTRRHAELCSTMAANLTYQEKSYLVPQDPAWLEFVDTWLALRLAEGVVDQVFVAHGFQRSAAGVSAPTRN